MAEPNIGVCTKAVSVGRKAYNALIELQARRRQRATRPKSNTENKLSDVVISTAQITQISVCGSLIFASINGNLFVSRMRVQLAF